MLAHDGVEGVDLGPPPLLGAELHLAAHGHLALLRLEGLGEGLAVRDLDFLVLDGALRRLGAHGLDVQVRVARAALLVLGVARAARAREAPPVLGDALDGARALALDVDAHGRRPRRRRSVAGAARREREGLGPELRAGRRARLFRRASRAG